MLGFTSTYQIVAQNCNYSMVAVTGPVLQVGVWYNIVTSYSSTNGIRLWLNGTLIGSSGPFTYASSGLPNTLVVGTSPVPYCQSGTVVTGQFYGMMDELRIYSRELNSSDIYALANP